MKLLKLIRIDDYKKVKIERLDNFGRGICFINNKICFVYNALDDEEVEIEITNETKRFYEAKVVKYYFRSKDRCDSCIYYNECGGCSLDHMNYDRENEFKLNNANNILKRIGKIDYTIKDIIYDKEYNYRNKIVLHSDGKKIGLYNNKSNNIVEIDNCKLVSPLINKLIKDIKRDDKEITIRVNNTDDDYLISNDNKKIIYTNIGNVKYKININSFFQVNRFLTVRMYDFIKQFVLELNPKSILDLYCGVLSIGIYVCHNTDIKLIGVDINEDNINCAIDNIQLNKVNGDVYKSDVSKALGFIKEVDLVIVDPPRGGLDYKTINVLNYSNIKRIIYVSCNITTLARDLNILNNYSVKEMKLFNMFPRTYHVETVSVLCRRN